MPNSRDKPKRKRRWFRFSLKTLVLLLTICAIWLGLLVHRVNKQKEAVQWVKNHGGAFNYDFQLNEAGELIDDADPPGPDWLAELIGIDYFADVVFVACGDSEIQDIGPLRALTQLRWLYLHKTRVADLSPLRDMTRLQELILMDTPVSDLGPLRELTELRYLLLSRTHVSNLSPLRKLTQLRSLFLHDTQVSDLLPLVKMNGRIHLRKNQQVMVPEELADRVVWDRASSNK